MARKTPTSCNPMEYEGDAPGYALHVRDFHGVDVPDALMDAWCQGQFIEIDALHRAVVPEWDEA